MSGVICVTNISSKTSEKEVRDFFSFCGKISRLEVKRAASTDGTQSAVVVFEKETAAKTALLLDNTKLGSSEVQVIWESFPEEGIASKAGDSQEASNNTLAQEDKPRSRIFAEYLAHGYVMSDKAIEQALAADRQHGISERFTNTLKKFDESLQARQHLQEIDSKLGIRNKAEASWQGLYSYFDKIAKTQAGNYIRAFYDQKQKEVFDVHNEARYLADLKLGKAEPYTQAPNSGTDEKDTELEPEKASMETVEIRGEIRTRCNCGGEDGRCPCAPGACVCSGCSKAS